MLKVPELAQKLSQQQSFNIFFEYIEKASKDASLNVRMAVVESLAGYLATLDKEKVKDNGVGLVMNMAKDENQSIRTGLIQKMKDLLEVVGEEAATQYLLPMIENALNDKKWRFKVAVAESLHDLFKVLRYEQHKDFFHKIVRAFMKDHYCAVREQTINSILGLKGVLGLEVEMAVISDLVTTLINDANYVYRVTAIQLMLRSHHALDKNDFNEVFVTVCKAVEHERVPNIAIVMLDGFPKVRGSLTGSSRKEFQAVLRRFRDIDDEDVQYYANQIEE